MKLPTTLLVSSALLTGCSSPTPTDGQAKASFLCVPSEYVVAVPGSGSSDDDFDPEGGGYSTSILIESQEVARDVSGYQPKVQVGKSEHHQSLYVMLAPSSHFQRSLSDLGPTRPMEEHAHLAGEDADSFTWEVVEESDGSRVHWGTCADQFTDTESFDCQRILRIDELFLTYPLAQANIHLYPQIDDLLREKVDQWRCESGDIPVDR